MNTTKKLTMAQALVLFLDNQYIEIDGEETKFVHGVMGIFGHGNAVGLGQALHQYKDQVRFIQGKNEQDIAHACMAYAKQNRRRAIYACTASVGPGSLNLVTAAGNATVNKIPLLLLPADTFADRQPAYATSIEKAANLIAAARKPFIISGGGVRYSDAGRAIAALSDQFKIPVAETQAGKGELSSEHPYYTGCVGICGTLAANELMKDADLIIAVGTKLNDFVTNSKGGVKHPDIPVVSINVSRMDALKMDSCSVVADARAGVQALERALAERHYQSGYRDEISLAQSRWQVELDRLSQLSPREGLSQTRVLMELNQLLGQDDVIIAASGSLPSDLERIWTVKAPGTYHLEYGFSCMGYETAGALGVKMAEPDKEVFVFVGDGGFLMSHSNLVTSLQEKKKMNILLFNNNGHQCIHNLQRSQGIDTFGTEFRYREDATGDLTGSYVPIDFVKVAEGYGAKSCRVRTVDELKAAIAWSRQEKQSTLIEISVLPGTMTDGYANFWRVGTASVAETESVQAAAKRLETIVKTIRKY